MSGSAAAWPLNSIESIVFNPARCRAELDEFDNFLRRHPSLAEERQVLPFFRERPQLSILLGSYGRNVRAYDRLAFELRLFDDFIADLVVGDSRRQSFCFIEFEDGRPESIFRVGKRRTLEWSPRFDHGASQIIDWFWKIDDQRRTTALERLFGATSIEASGLLVVGRDSGVATSDLPRLRWRRERVAVNAQQLYICTFDELARDLRDTLETFANVSAIL